MALQIYLSPHLDDAALSCGGTIHQQAARGDHVIVLTLFAGDPPETLSPFAQTLHARWQLGPDAVARRRAEDHQAITSLGATPLWLPYPDCIYRYAADRWLYATEEALFGPLATEDQPLIARLVQEIRSRWPSPPTTLHVPLGVGHHVDHQIAHQVGAQLERQGWSVRYYEDYPYAEDPHALKEALGEHLWHAELVELTQQDLHAKQKAVLSYRSQLSTFWSDEATCRRALEHHSRRTAGGVGLAERYWSRR